MKSGYWVQMLFVGQGSIARNEEVTRNLKRELAKVKQERDFLKQAAAYFAKESRLRYACIDRHRNTVFGQDDVSCTQGVAERLLCLADFGLRVFEIQQTGP